MRNLAPSLPQQSRSAGLDAAIGQIDLIGEFGEIVKSWRIRSPRCTLGSGSDCSVQLTTPGIAPLHAVLIFGKKHTLLRSVGPTLISNRHVREWLIDQPTEIAVGQSRLVIHPSIGVLATVVHAENLLDHAARMGKVATPLIQELPSANANVDSSQIQPIATPIGTNETKIDSAASARLDTIERLLESLQMSLDKMQESLGTEAKCANESILESVTQEIDAFGKKLFTNLNDQWNNQTGVQQSLISHLADKFSDRFHSLDEQLSNQTGTQQSLFLNLADRFTDGLGAIDAQLNRFSEATSKHTSSLNELLAQAGREQEMIEARFNEVISHRNELVEAVQVLRSEIALAYQAPEYRVERSANGSEVPESAPDYSFADESSHASHSRFSDDQLAQSLELAQIQIQELNAQLRHLEVERDSAQQKVALLIESWPSEQPSEQAALESDPSSEILYGSPVEVNGEVNAEVTSEEFSYPAETNEVVSDHNQLPAWFKQDAPEASNVEWAANPSYAQDAPVLLESESNFASFSAPDLTSYSDIGYESAPLENIPPLDQPVESSNSNLDSISERLQRMLLDADHRRGTSNPSSELRTSSSWSQRYSNQPKGGFENREPDSIERDALEDEARAEVGPTVPGQVVPVVSDSPVSEGREPHFPVSLRHLYRDQPTEYQEQPIEYQEQPIEQMVDESTDASDSIDSSEEADPSGRVDDQTDELISPTSNAGANSVKRGSDEEESIEDYMQRLLHRVRGGGENSPTEIKSAPTTPSPTGPAKTRSRIAASMGLDKPDSEISLPEERLSEELFVPRQQAPEQRNDLVALRELANTNARRAITRSDIRRTNSAFFLKLGVTALAVSSAAALFMFNGLTLNAPFVGMVAAVIVAVLWGYDCANHFKRLKNVGGLNKVTAAETAAGQSIRVSSAEESGWRPTAD